MGSYADDGFDVIAPALPGFGFAGKPALLMGPRKIADVSNSLITDVLGYDDYIAQGVDWGGVISNWLGFEHAACYTIHINILTTRHPHGPQNTKEQA